MPLIPSWAPNFHPLVIHFPIVLVMTAAVVDLVDVVFERSAWLRAATTTLYVAGAIATIVAYRHRDCRRRRRCSSPAWPIRCSAPIASGRW